MGGIRSSGPSSLFTVVVMTESVNAERRQTHAARNVSLSQSQFRLARRLEEAIAEPEHWDSLKRRYSNVRISHYALGQLARIQSLSGLRTLSQVVDFLIESSRPENRILPASKSLIFADDRPVCLAGPSGTGKSLFLKTVLPSIPGPLLVVDLADEHEGLKQISIGNFFDIKWGRANADTRLKFVPSGNLDVSKGELRTIFSHLNMLKLDGHSPDKLPSGVLANWTLIVEEAHRLVREPAFQNFLAEGRKFVRKIIVIASDPALYAAVCRLFKPPALEELLSEKR